MIRLQTEALHTLEGLQSVYIPGVNVWTAVGT